MPITVLGKSWNLATKRNAMIFLMSIIIVPSFYLFSGIIGACLHRLLHGSITKFDNESIALPLLWEIDNGEHHAIGLHLNRVQFGNSVGARIILKKLNSFEINEHPKAIDWQNDILKDIQSRRSTISYQRENVQVNGRVFYCIVNHESNADNADLTCRSDQGNEMYAFVGKEAYMNEAMSILLSLKE
jgi:hypothetical protein